MKCSRIAIKLPSLLLIAFAAVTVARGQERPAEKKVQDKPLTREEMIKLDRKAVKPPSGTGFFVARVNQAAFSFTVLLCDQEARCETGQFNQDQLESFEAIAREASKFAQTDEEVGKAKPITTRFYDRHDQSFIVDVTKLGSQSQFFVTMKTGTGRLTIDAGTIKRGEPSPKALFYDLVERVVATKASPPQ